jgi:hypothetical protein
MYTLLRQASPLNNPPLPSHSISETTNPEATVAAYERRIQAHRDLNKLYKEEVAKLRRENEMLRDLRFGSDGFSRVDL